MTERHYWLSSARMTVYAAVGEDGRVAETAPICRRFIGQPLGNLTGWLERIGGFEMAELGAAAPVQREEA